MNRTLRTLVGIAHLALVLGCARTPVATAPKSAPQAQQPASAPAPAPAKPSDGITRYDVPLGGPTRGPETATIEIVVFSDFQCPFCARLAPELERLRQAYPTQVRIHFRHSPLDFHAKAALAAEAAVAAEAQGKFWEMHDRLFANQDKLDRPALEDHARALGLDVAKFRAALDHHTWRARVGADLALAKRLGVPGTPILFINGADIQGAQPYDVLKRFVDDELVRVIERSVRGTSKERLYESFMAGALPTLPKSGAPGAGAEVYKIAPGDAPRRGGAAPKVTIIEFSDFECPFCAQVVPTLKTLLRDYGDDVALVFKHNPLPFHERAMPAALAAEAARQQGKFWEMHDELFADQKALDDEGLRRKARELGLDLKRFDAARDAAETKARVRREIDEAARFGARGTPNFFINGRNLRGAQPVEAFKAAVDAAIANADAQLKAGTPRAQLYTVLTKDGRTAAPPDKPHANAPDPNRRLRAPIDGAPTRGAADALVTIVEWSDFQCPFCARVEPTLARVLERWKGDVRLVWRDQPLPFHPAARPAARAARAAGAQGKFWEMHDKLFADQAHLDRQTFETYARDLGLDLVKFKAALDAPETDDAVSRDSEVGMKVGARATPTFFVNGMAVSGAQPFDVFDAKIEAELKVARALVEKGTPRAKVYATLMRDAAERDESAAKDANAQEGPEKDETVTKVATGNSPSRGPKDAALVVVEFGDFQCPFCRRVEPTLARLQREYPGRVRVVWKHFPLTSHTDAGPAAQAAQAAHAQGRFWEMHDKLIATDAALDTASLEGYAGELGLDLARFRADLTDERLAARIDADVDEGQHAGVTGTPTVFVNGRKIGGAWPWETFKAIADAELAKAEKELGTKTKAKTKRH